MDEEMKQELTAIKTELKELRATDRRIIAMLVRLEGKFDDMGERMATKETVDVISRNVDGLAKQFEEFRFRLAVQSDTLVKHDKRLTKLEARR